MRLGFGPLVEANVLLQELDQLAGTLLQSDVGAVPGRGWHHAVAAPVEVHQGFYFQGVGVSLESIDVVTLILVLQTTLHNGRPLLTVGRHRQRNPFANLIIA